jgi:hypothetical protein
VDIALKRLPLPVDGLHDADKAVDVGTRAVTSSDTVPVATLRRTAV